MDPRPRNRPTRRRARGQKINLAIFFLVVVVGYVVWRLTAPEIIAYQVTGIMKVVCNEYMRQTFFNHPKAWERTWQSRVRKIGISQMGKQQYKFTVSDPCTGKQCSCDAEAVFELTTPWVFLEDFIDIKPRRTVHRKKQHVDYRAYY